MKTYTKRSECRACGHSGVRWMNAPGLQFPDIVPCFCVPDSEIPRLIKEGIISADPKMLGEP